MISNEWLARFRNDLEHALDAPTRGDIRALLREYDRMREIVEAVALREMFTQYAPATSGPVLQRCFWCRETGQNTSRIRHHDDCEVVKARLLVGLPAQKADVESNATRAEQKQRANMDAVADGEWPPHPSEY